MADLWLVTLVSPPYAAWTYERPSHFPDLAPGQRVIIPLGNSHRAGVVIGPAEQAPEGVEVKEMIWPLERAPLMSAEYVDMAVNLAARQMVGVGRILEIALPRGLRTAAVTFKVDNHMAVRELPATVRPRTSSVSMTLTGRRSWICGRPGACGFASAPGKRPRSGSFLLRPIRRGRCVQMPSGSSGCWSICWRTGLAVSTPSSALSATGLRTWPPSSKRRASCAWAS